MLHSVVIEAADTTQERRPVSTSRTSSQADDRSTDRCSSHQRALDGQAEAGTAGNIGPIAS
jgi:hypothetical protein